MSATHPIPTDDRAHDADATVVDDPGAEGPGEAAALPDQPEVGTDLVAAPPGGGAIIRAEDPTEMIAKATRVANALRDLLERQNLAVNVGGKRRHVEVGGWQALGWLLGTLGGVALHAETAWSRPARSPETGELLRHSYTVNVKRFYRGGGLREEVEYDVDGHDWEACVEIRTPGGVVVGRAEALCSRAEEKWNQKDDFALKSMAETRAEGRAWRRAAGWLVNIAGYQPTPAEEMGHTPGAQFNGDEPPGWAAFADDASLGRSRRALAYLLRDDLRGDRVERVGFALTRLAGGGIPMIAVAALTETATVLSRHQRAEAAAAAAAAGAARGTIDPPAGKFNTPLDELKALKQAGCTCPDPLQHQFDDDCPIRGHFVAI